MTDRDKAVAALERAGFTHLEGNRWIRTHDGLPDTCDVGEDMLVELCLVGRHADLPALLSPLTMEMVHQAIKESVYASYKERGWILPTQYDIGEGVAKPIIERLRQQMGGGQ